MGEEELEAAINKLYYGAFHQSLGELAMDVLGGKAEIAEAETYAFSELSRMYLYFPVRHDLRRGASNPTQYHCRANIGSST